ncbi:hypothetical protein Ancab_014226 [Ancistrocladus abbreviatus]
MQQTLNFTATATAVTTAIKNALSPFSELSSPSRTRPKFPVFPTFSSRTTTIPLPPKPSKLPQIPFHSPPPPAPGAPTQHHHHHHQQQQRHPPSLQPCQLPHLEFQEKVLFLDSIGLDTLSLLTHNPSTITAASLHDLKSLADFLASFGFSPAELRRIFNICPEILSFQLNDIVPVFTFLLREAKVSGSDDLRRVISRRPRLLTCDVETRLRPTLYFLQSIGIQEKIGFSYHDTISMFKKFPTLFCYSVRTNFEPKFNYFMVEMGRELKELKDFPQYFSFSLERRIKPRHQYCVDNGVCFPLPVLLKTGEKEFRDRLEVYCNSSMPLNNSPLWGTNHYCDC